MDRGAVQDTGSRGMSLGLKLCFFRSLFSPIISYDCDSREEKSTQHSYNYVFDDCSE